MKFSSQDDLQFIRHILERLRVEMGIARLDFLEAEMRPANLDFPEGQGNYCSMTVEYLECRV